MYINTVSILTVFNCTDLSSYVYFKKYFRCILPKLPCQVTKNGWPSSVTNSLAKKLHCMKNRNALCYLQYWYYIPFQFLLLSIHTRFFFSKIELFRRVQFVATLKEIHFESFSTFSFGLCPTQATYATQQFSDQCWFE